MASIAMFAALIDGKCHTLILKDPPATLDVGSNPDGRGEALELLNVLQITDVHQLPALNYPTKSIVIGAIPDTYEWSLNTLKKLHLNEHVGSINKLSELNSQ